MFLTTLEYKCKWYGVNLIRIDRFAPSSKTCVNCGHVYKGLKLSERSWVCGECGAEHDRDLNAARNIKEFGLIGSTLGARGSEACGETNSGRTRRRSPKKRCFEEAGKVKANIRPMPMPLGVE
jgi:transposase